MTMDGAARGRVARAWRKHTQERRRKIKAKETAKTVLGILEDRKAENIVSIDVKGRSTLTDVIIVATGTSEPHLKALADTLQMHFKKAGDPPRVSGDSESAWIVLDLFDVIVHLFLPDARAYYDIETLWKDKPKKEAKEAKTAKTAKAAKPAGKAKAATAAKPQAKAAAKKPAATGKAKTAAKKTGAKARSKAAPKKAAGAGE